MFGQKTSILNPGGSFIFSRGSASPGNTNKVASKNESDNGRKNERKIESNEHANEKNDENGNEKKIAASLFNFICKLIKLIKTEQQS